MLGSAFEERTECWGSWKVRRDRGIKLGVKITVFGGSSRTWALTRELPIRSDGGQEINLGKLKENISSVI
jgi:hypothetical protein